MRDLVNNAREVRRLIREASFDSTCSDLSLGDFSLNENIGGSTADDMDAICRGIHQLIDNCDSLEDEMYVMPPEARLPESKSTMSGLSQYSTNTDTLVSGGEDETV